MRLTLHGNCMESVPEVLVEGLLEVVWRNCAWDPQNAPISQKRRKRANIKTTPVGFEPTRGDPIGLAG